MNVTPAKVRFYFDPVCPWTWITSRWMDEVARQRDIEVEWRTYSLRLKNADRELQPKAAEHTATAFGALRVIEAARAAHGDHVVGPLYTQIGTLLHHDQDVEPAGLAGAIERAGLDPALAAARDATA